MVASYAQMLKQKYCNSYCHCGYEVSRISEVPSPCLFVFSRGISLLLPDIIKILPNTPAPGSTCSTVIVFGS